MGVLALIRDLVTQNPRELRAADGDLLLKQDPTTALGAATKQYVDTGNALHVLKAGDTMTGPLVVDQGTVGAATVGDPGSSSARFTATAGGQPTSSASWDCLGEQMRFFGAYRGAAAVVFANYDLSAKIWTFNYKVTVAPGLTLGPNGSSAVLNVTTSGASYSAFFTDVGLNGCGIRYVGNGTTTPGKYMRVVNGLYQIVNDGYTAVILSGTDAGAWTAPSFTNTSDEKLKKNIALCEADNYLADKLDFVTFDWKADDWANNVRGVIAQQVQSVAPQYVHADALDIEGKPVLSVNKIDLLLECIIGLASRVRELESKLKGEL
jgi:hypothetical protein